MQTTSIADFYSGLNIFITGGTGFVGKVLIEKLLRSCPDIGDIYVLIRPKKGKSIQERLQTTLNDQLFSTIKSINADSLKKIHPIQGDCSELSLGLSPDDYKLIIEKVSVIFHSAASVRFDDFLRDAVLLNTRGTREVAELALKTVQLKVFVHISTTFCNCVFGSELSEEMYPPPADWKQVIEVAERSDKQTLEYLNPMYIGDFPNTYTFTKALGEHVVRDICGGKVPTVIARPSIVVSTYKEPVKGWIDNFNGPVALLVACGKGLLRQSYQNPDIPADYVPVDVVAKASIVAGWDIGLRQDKSDVEVIQISGSQLKWVTMGEVIRLGRELSASHPLNDIIWVPKGFVTRCRTWAYICTIFFHLIPAFFLDLGLRFMGKKPFIARLQVKIYNASLQLRYFTWKEWKFQNEKYLRNLENILEKDKNDWNYDFHTIDFKDFIRESMIGARKYLLNEPEETIPKAKIHYQRMYWLDKITMFVLYSSMFYLIIQSGIIETISSKISNSFVYLFNRELV